MKIILFVLFLSLSSLANGDTVEKWVDEKGNIHYGDKKAAEDIKGSETLKV
jgi:isoprenylcysteine carboxyl methyltransferase (ICMT) family protein YpbQ